MTWMLNGEPMTEIPADAVGFVYLITRVRDGKAYVGKKGFWTAVTKPPLKGRRNKRRSRKESDWRDYWGSNKELQLNVPKEGPLGFTREVLRVCYTKSEMTYYETKEQFDRDVLLSDKYFNSWISAKITKNHMKDHHK